MPRVGQHARAGLAPPGGLAVEVAGRTLGEALACVAWARRGHAVHLRGAVHRARLVIDDTRHATPSSRLLATPTEHEALVRFSRSLGLPRPLPDLLAMSLRVLDAHRPGRHQNFLPVSPVDLPVPQHFFGAASDVQQRVHSSSLPYRCGDATFLIGALPDPSSPRPAGDDELNRLARAAATGELAFGLTVAPVGGRFRRVATIPVGERLPRRSTPCASTPSPAEGGLWPIGVLNRLRDYAYPLSQHVWTARRRTGRRARGQAEPA